MMLLKRKCDISLLVYTVVLFLLDQTLAFGLRPKKSAPRVEEDIQSKLATLIRPEFPSDDGVYKHALEILSSLEATPACGRVATAGLLTSCQEIDGAKKDAELWVQNLKSTYAAQLAICEISETGSSVPQACQEIAIRYASPIKSTKVSKTGSRQIGECLQALETKPQWWTSYSNSRQNAVTLCQAARSDIDRDEFIKVNRKIVDTQSEAHAALSKAAKVSHEQFNLFRNEFIQSRRAFQDQLTNDLNVASTKTRSSFESLTGLLTTAVETAINALRSVSGTAESQMEDLGMKIASANVATNDFEKGVGKVFQKIVEGSSELANVQSTQWQTNKGVAQELASALKFMQEDSMNAMTLLINDMGVRLDHSNHLIAQLFNHHRSLEAGMGRLTESFSHLESRAEAIGATQSQQAETQYRLHDQMEVQMQVTQGYLSDVTNKASRLQEAVSRTASEIQSLTAFTQLFSTVYDWTIIISGCILLGATGLFLRALWRFNHTIACCVAAAITLLSIRGILHQFLAKMTINLSLSKTWVFETDHLLPHVCLAIGFSLLFGLLYFASKACDRKLKRCREPSDLPFFRALRRYRTPGAMPDTDKAQTMP